jgi:hypothetical protein
MFYDLWDYLKKKTFKTQLNEEFCYLQSKDSWLIQSRKGKIKKKKNQTEKIYKQENTKKGKVKLAFPYLTCLLVHHSTLRRNPTCSSKNEEEITQHSV